MKKYRLNFDWNGYKKGHVFEENEHGTIEIPSTGKTYTPITFEWFNYKKGHVFEADNDGDIPKSGNWITKEIVDLLVLSGALTEVVEVGGRGGVGSINSGDIVAVHCLKVELPEEYHPRWNEIECKECREKAGSPPLCSQCLGIRKMNENQNQLIRYLKAQEK